MATYTITSKTLWGNTCVVTLTTASGSGSYTLQGASEPFEMEMDDSTDINTTLRPTTGTVRFIVEDSSVVNDILPSNLLDTKVEVMLYDENGQNGVQKFFGYVEVTEYSQPYDSTPYEMELPVRDIVSLLEDVTIEPNDDEYFGQSLTFSQYLVEAMEALGFAPKGVYVECVSNAAYGVLSQTAQREWFISEKTSYSGDTSTKSVEGCSFADAIDKFLLPNAMCLRFEDGYLKIRRHYQGGFYYLADWDSWIKECTPTNTPGTLDAGSFLLNLNGIGDSLTNMSASNTVDYITPVKRILVNQKIEDTSVFEFDGEWCGDWKLYYANDYGNRTCSFQYKNDGTTQRGVSIPRYVQTSFGMGDAVPDDYQVDLFYNSNPIVGGVLADIEEYDYDSRHSQSNIQLPSTPSLLTAPIRNSLDADQEMIKELSFADFYCPVTIDTRKGGCLCFNATVKLTYGEEINGQYVPHAGQTTESATYIWAAFELIDKNGNRYMFADNTIQSGWHTPDFDVRDTVRLIFRNDGSILGNYVGHETVYCYVSSGSALEPQYVNTISQGDRYKYKNGEGYFLTLDGFPGDAGEYRLHVRLFAEYSSGLSGWSSSLHWRWLCNNHFFVTVSDFKVTWHPVTFNGTLPSPGDDSSGTFSATYLDLPDEKTHVCTSTGDNGEDLTVDLDTWGDGDGVKWGNTVQPDLCDTNVFDTISKQYVKTREIVSYDDARFTGSYFDQYNEGGKTYIGLSSSWKASNEGGRKKFIQLL